MSYQVPDYQLYAFQAPQSTLSPSPTIAGIYTYDPDLAELFEDAFERAGMSVTAIGQEHIASAIRSVKLMINSEWSTYGFRQWMVQTESIATITGEGAYVLPDGAVMVFNAILRRQNADTQMYAISRSDYDAISTKGTQGRPNQFFINKQHNGVEMMVWPVAENSTDTIVVDYMRQISQPGKMYNTLQIPSVALECFTAGLAMRLAQKFNKDRWNDLRVDYGGPYFPERLGGKLFHMRSASGEEADTQFTFRR